MRDSVCRLDRRNDTLDTAEVLECIYRLIVGDRNVLCAADIVQVSVLRADAGVIQTGGDGVNRSDLTVLVLAEIALHAVENAQTAGSDGRGGLCGVDTAACGFTADQAHALILDEVVKRADGVRAAADTCHHDVREFALLFEHLLLDLLGDDRLEIAHDGRERVRAHARAEAVMRVVNAGSPLAEGGGASILERARAGRNRDDLRAEQAHAVHVERLTLGVLHAHEHHALHAHQGCGRRSRNTVLTGTGLCDQTGLAHFFRQQRLTEHVVDLMCAGVVEILALEIDLRTAEVTGHMLRKVQPRRTACVVVQQLGQLCVEFRIVLIVVVGFLQLDNRVHQRFRHILTAVYAKTSLAHWFAPFTSADTRRILSISFTSSVSMPLDRSSAYAPVCAALWTLVSCSPPARKYG